MSVKHLGLRDINYLCAVAEHLNFGKAADACAISQPAMSGRIQHIEDILNTKIFERSKRQVLITDKGQQIIALAQSILDTADSIDQLSREHALPLSGNLRLGVIATLGPYLMPLILPPLAKQFPALNLQLTEGLTEDLLASLSAGSLDMVIAAKPIPNDNVTMTDLFFEPFQLAAPKHHSIGATVPVPGNKLNGKDMVLLSEGHCLSGQALSVCPVRKQQGETRLQATSLETLRHMIASGKQYSLLPVLAIGKTPPLQSMIDYLPLAGSNIGRRIVLCTRRTSRRSDDAAALSGVIKAHLAEGITAL